MGERLRSRDARFNSNKCYTIFFDDENDDSRTTNSLKAAKMKIARSPSKKRESPTKKSRKSTTVVGVQDVRMETVQTTDALPVGNELANEPAENSPSFMENVALFNKERQNDDGLTAILETERADEACDAGLFAKRSDNGGGGEKNAEKNKIEHVVVSDDEDDNNDQDNEEETKSESLRSKNSNKRKFSASLEFDSLQVVENKVYLGEEEEVKKMKLSSAKEQMFEVFQPWALKTYGDQAKTKTITQRKKNRILKALDGKEQNNPDSSKFRFWVKSKGFTIHRPQSSCNNSTRIEAWTTRGTVPLEETISSQRGIAGGTGCEVSATATTQVLDTQKDHIDLYVASTSKDFGERVYRKVAVVEEFFDIIYNVHVEQGGRNGRHAGQKRTYRIITETYAFLPREAVTKFLGSCPTCKRNQRPFSPSRFDETFTETSSEYEALNYSSQNESSLDSTQLRPIGSVRRKAEGKASPLVTNSYTEIMDPVANETKCDMKVVEKNQSFLKSDKTWREPVESSKFDEDMQTKCDRNLGLERNFIASVFSENFKISNLLKTQSTGINNPGLKSSCSKTKHAYLSYDWLDHKARISELSHCQYIHQLYDLTKKISSVKSEPNLDNINRPVISKDNLDSSIDLTINQPSSININIGNSYGIDTLPQSSTGPPSCEPVDDLYFNSLDVSINMSNSSNELKISYKTTPPKKRYNLCKDKQLTSHSSLNAFCDDIPMEGEECAINLTKQFRNDSDKTRSTSATVLPAVELSSKSKPFRVDLDKVKPITSTYLRMTRSFGLTDEDALSIDDLETLPTPAVEPPLPETNPEEAYAGLMKDADKLKLMLLAWNYQNSNAIRNGSEAPDLGVVGGLWAQYQNALALNAKQPSVSPVNRTDQSSPIENQDETNSSGQKDEDDGSEDDSDDKLDQNAHDPERLKAFNMFVRLFVDENLDRMIPISKQPKEKIQAIIDSCARQFPEFCERSRKRIRTYLKSCRRNKKAREGWDNASRPTPAHLTSVQAEQILAIACENESLNAKRMRIGLDPISQSLPLAGNSTSSTDAVAPSITYPGFRSTPSTTVSTMDVDLVQPSTTVQTIPSARSSPISLTTNPQTNADPKTSTATVNAVVTSQIASPLYRPADFASPSSTSSPYSTSARPAPTYPTFFPTSNSTNVTPTDLSMKQHTQTTLQTPVQSLPALSTTTAATSVTTTGRPPLLSHKLNPNEISAVRQLVTGYRESAAFLLRSADELEQLLLQQQ